MKREIKFVDNKTNVPIVKFNLPSGAEGYAIVDSGSESSLLDYDFVKSNKDEFNVNHTAYMVNLIGIKSKAENPLVEADGIICLDEIQIPIQKAMLINLSSLKEQVGFDIHGIIGSDVLSTIKAKIDYKNNVLVINTD